MNNILTIKNLHVSFNTYAGKVYAVRGVDLSLEKGKTLAIVGESGSGKSVTSKAITRLLPKDNAFIERGEIWFDGRDLLQLKDKDMRKIRGADISVIFQDPMTALNPTMKIGKQVMESAVKHQKLKPGEAKRRAIELFELVGMPNPEKRLKQYPHEFSGGMRQRAVIAMALACNPKLLIADEPTTALDVTIQAQILEQLKKIQEKIGTTIIFITHDLGVVANIADYVAVMYAGKIVEKGTTEEIFYTPKHPYNLGLLKSMPDLNTKGKLYAIPGSPPDLMTLTPGDAFAPRNDNALAIDYEIDPPMFPVSDTHSAATWLLHPQAPMLKNSMDIQSDFGEAEETFPNDKEVLIEAKGLKKHFDLNAKQSLKAVDGIDIEIKRGETYGLVGESGCGKSTLGRTLIGLYEPTEGNIHYNNKPLDKMKQLDLSRKIQMIFQDPYSSLDPRKKVEDIIAEGLDIHRLYKKDRERKKHVQELLELVGLQSEHASRYPHEFSGGQRQRIGIARALAVSPEMIIADEPISSLDVSIQAQVVNLLKELQEERDLTYLFIAHDLSMVKYISDRIGVMYLGKMMELGDAEEIYQNPLHPYTQVLLSAIPKPDPNTEKERERIIIEGDIPSPVEPPIGCPFRTRCPFATELCEEVPEWREIEEGHWAACHYA